DLDFYRDLGERTDRYRYVKDASGDMHQAMSLLQHLGGELGVMIGMDTIMLPVFAMGAVGTVWRAPHYMPRECVALWEHVQAGRLDEARAGSRAMWPALDLITSEGYAVGTKTACRLLGQDLGPCRAPYTTLPAELEAELDRRLEEVRAGRG